MILTKPLNHFQFLGLLLSQIKKSLKPFLDKYCVKATTCQQRGFYNCKCGPESINPSYLDHVSIKIWSDSRPQVVSTHIKARIQEGGKFIIFSHQPPWETVKAMLSKNPSSQQTSKFYTKVVLSCMTRFRGWKLGVRECVVVSNARLAF